eukprot:124039-Chlamydomonas_euryale.AAC.7
MTAAECDRPSARTECASPGMFAPSVGVGRAATADWNESFYLLARRGSIRRVVAPYRHFWS